MDLRTQSEKMCLHVSSLLYNSLYLFTQLSPVSSLTYCWGHSEAVIYNRCLMVVTVLKCQHFLTTGATK